MDHVTITPDGRIALPKDVIDALHLGSGSRLTVELHGQQVVLAKEASESVADSDFRAHLLGGPKVDDFVIEPDLSPGRPVEL